MHTTNDFFDMLKAKRGFTSDYAIAKFLGRDQSRISHYRQKRGFIDNKGAIWLAERVIIF